MRTIRAVVFDVDGVLIDTARLHARAWKETFDRFLASRGLEEEFRLPDDYRRHVDGRPRYEGVAAFLRSRNIEVPYGAPEDEPGLSTVTAIGNLKNSTFRDLIRKEGVEILPGAEGLLAALHSRGTLMAVVSSSRNAIEILPRELKTKLDVELGGESLDDLDLPGKPDPAMFLEAAVRLGAEPRHTAVVEDAPAGVRAGRQGGFGLVVGIGDETSGLTESGADVVVGGIGDLPVDIGKWTDLLSLPAPAMDSMPEIIAALDDWPAVFLDYDGTLTPIVDDPANATIGESERKVLRRLAARAPVAIVSGRGLDDVRSLVGVANITYAGSHGFEIVRPDGSRYEHETAAPALPDLDRAQSLLEDGSADLDGVVIERKRFAIAVHTRRAASQQIRERAAQLARDVAAKFDRLALTGGKEVHELRPDVDWDKGAALAYLLETLPDSRVPLYIGDDVTDEDAFSKIRTSGKGVAVLVGRVTDPAQTWATYTLVDTVESLEFLDRLARAYESEG
ncbi:MAG TPA: trehalose-phosphatase [Acidimicrobiia bacterium]